MGFIGVMKESIVTLPTSGGPMDLHCFLPESAAGRLPAVIVLQEAFGVNPHMKRVCRRVAQAGYAVFSPELFHRSGKGLEFGYDEFPRIKPILAEITNAMVLDDLRATHGHVSQRPDVDPARIASWGFCLGGWASVLAACELPVAAAISFYGGGMVNARPGFGFNPILDRFSSIRCPLLLVYGAKDQGITPADIDAVTGRLRSLGKQYELEIYPNGGHGFFCEDRSAYDRGSAEAAWSRATGWLASKLG
jgi:carboxymethylenebutenolidase